MYVIVGGGGMVGGELARNLMADKHDVVMIDSREETCNRVYSETGAVVVHGSISQISVLEEAGIRKADVVVAATASDADNLACAILAKSENVPQVIVRMHNPAYQHAYEVSGAHKIVRVTDLMVNQLLMDIEHPELQRITSIGEGKGDIFMVNVPENSWVAGLTVQDIASSGDFPRDCTFVAIHNTETKDFDVCRGDSIIHQGDEIFLIASGHAVKQALKVLTARCNKHSKVHSLN